MSLADVVALLDQQCPGARVLLYTCDVYDGTAILVYSATAAERLRDTLDPHADNRRLHSRSSAMLGGSINTIEASDLCAQLLKGNPRYCSLLLQGALSSCVHLDSAFEELIAAAPSLLGAAFIKSCSHQAHGIMRSIMKCADGPYQKHDDNQTARAHVDWETVAHLIDLCARAPTAAAHFGETSTVPQSLRRAASERPLSMSGEELRAWQALIAAHVAMAKDAQAAESSAYREAATAFLEDWMQRHVPGTAATGESPGVSKGPSAAKPAGELAGSTACESAGQPTARSAGRSAEQSAAAEIANSSEVAPAAVPPSAEFVELLNSLGMPRPVSEIVHAVQSGSKMYGVNVASSDADYHLVYLSSSSQLLALRERVAPHKLNFSRAVAAPYGADKDGIVEYSCSELAHFTHTLTRGNPSAVELLFVPAAQRLAVQWPWDELHAMRQRFLTETAFQQYVGFIKVHLGRAKEYLHEWPASEEKAEAGEDEHQGAESVLSVGQGAESVLSVGQGAESVLSVGQGAESVLSVGQGAERTRGSRQPIVLEPSTATSTAKALAKTLYHSFHKLFEARRLLQGEELHVALRGEERSFVLGLRTLPLHGERAPAKLMAKAEALLSELLASHAALATPLRAAPDAATLNGWLHSVRVRNLRREGQGNSLPLPVPPLPPPPRRAGSHTSTASSTRSHEESIANTSAGHSQGSEEFDVAVGEAEWARVGEALAQLEVQEGVEVLFAAERSSRTFGTHRHDSDLDVIAIFALPLEEMLSGRAARKSLKFAWEARHGHGDVPAESQGCGSAGGGGGGDGGDGNQRGIGGSGDRDSGHDVDRAGDGRTGEVALTIQGLELRHASTLLATSNPTLFEALRSPLVYRAAPEWLAEARSLLDAHYDAPSLERAY
eukprot:CAMPEP_0115850462 /NCGR_PEP_ID=MMETSP0287-20121206/11976_1 /TAXON_ID=412157 /ORGANISM="Chrysochromulina rotalis, Strain UIO044" /LENGTH=894 /DNA_ID=CAMNT_0003304459 /DNA_START=27 /DNA_END=2708 /DNA_ORIENTATION=-